MMKIGFMQGRLTPVQNGKIQEFPWNNWENEFEAGNRIGFDLIEWTLDQDRLYENPLMQPEGRTRIAELCNKYHISILSLTGDCFMQAPFFKATGDVFNSLCKDLKNIISACGELGIKYVLIPLVDNGRIDNNEQKIILHNTLAGLKPLLGAHGMKVIFESDFKPDDLKVFIADFDPAYFGINYDTGNSASLGYEPLEELAAYGERIDNVHIKDRLLGGTTVPLGEGNADFKKVFVMLKEIGYNGNYILQTARDKDGKHEEALIRFRNFITQFYESEFTFK